MSISKPRRGRAVPSSVTTPLLSKSSQAILRRVKTGEALIGTRTFPHAHRFKIHFKVENSERSQDVALTIIDELVSVGYIRALPASPRAPSVSARDVITYAITKGGSRFLAEGPPPPDATQLDWVEGA